MEIRAANSGGPGGPPGPLGLAIAQDSDPLPVELAWDLMEVTYLWPPLLSGSYHPRYEELVGGGYLGAHVFLQQYRPGPPGAVKRPSRFPT